MTVSLHSSLPKRHLLNYMRDRPEGSGLFLEKGIYRHYKGDLYEVLYMARHSESEEWMVVYRAPYGEKGVWVRPYEMFGEKIQIDGRTVKRFTFMESLD